jgi:hypothetical protein
LSGDEALIPSIPGRRGAGNAFCARGDALFLSGRNVAPRKSPKDPEYQPSIDGPDMPRLAVPRHQNSMLLQRRRAGPRDIFVMPKK